MDEAATRGQALVLRGDPGIRKSRLLSEASRKPAWRSTPTWHLIATDDRMIPPAAQHTMAQRTGARITEVPGSHAIYVSQPAAVASLITQAAQSVPSATSVA